MIQGLQLKQVFPCVLYYNHGQDNFTLKEMNSIFECSWNHEYFGLLAK